MNSPSAVASIGLNVIINMNMYVQMKMGIPTAYTKYSDFHCSSVYSTVLALLKMW